MKKEKLKRGNEILKQIEQLEIEHFDFRQNMGYNKKMPKKVHISGALIYAQTEITDEILISIILKEVDNRFIEKLKILQQEFKNL